MEAERRDASHASALTRTSSPSFAPFAVRDGMVAEVSGLDLAKAVHRLKDEIEAALATFPVLVFRGQDLTDDELQAFASLFGPLTPMGRHNENSRMGKGAVFDVSNVDESNSILAGESRRRIAIESARLWHVDSSYNPVPDSFSILYAKKVTSAGGETEFADLRASYDALPEATQAKIADLVGVHSRGATVRRAGHSAISDPLLAQPSAAHPIVRRNPLSGRTALYIASHMCGIEGMDDVQFEALLAELTAFSTADRFVCSHQWREGDLVLWDNRAVMHRGRPYDIEKEVRDLRQVRITERDYRALPLDRSYRPDANL